MTERLTEKIMVSKDGEILGYRIKPFHERQATQKLAEYENAEEEGRLVITPYKIGKVLFLPRRGEVFPFKVVGTRIYENRTEIDLIYCGSKDCYKFLSTHPFIEYVEHEYFKTREEAEKALKEMKKNERILY